MKKLTSCALALVMALMMLTGAALSEGGAAGNTFAVEEFHWTRRKAAMVGCIGMVLLSLPSALGYNVWKGVALIGGRDILNTEDFLVSNLLLPVGALVYLLFCSFRFGWGFDGYLEEANAGRGIRIARALRPYFRYVLPVLILLIFVTGLVGK